MQSKGNEKEEGMGFSNGLSNKFEDVSRYADLIGREHPVLKRHPQMSREDRAAQFSPFAALTGHEAAITETVRRAQERVEHEIEKELEEFERENE